MAMSASYTRDFVCDDGHTYARAADENSPVVTAESDRLGDFCAVIGVIA